MAQFRKNEFTLVGTLVSADIRTGNMAKDGSGYVSVKSVITNTINGKNCEYDVEFFAYEMTAEKKVSKLYQSYVDLKSMLNKKIEISGELKENKYWSTNLGQIVSTTVLSGKFVKGVLDTTPEVAKFEIGGFVAKTLTEKTNKSNEIYRYDLTLAQSNYSGDNLSMFTLHVNPDEMAIVRGVKNYEVGQTIKLNGTMVFAVEEKVVQDENTAFGAPVSRVYKNKTKSFFIEGGSNPIKDDTSYDMETIRNLIDAYKAKDVTLASAAKKEDAPAINEAPVKTRQTSLV